MKIIKTKFKDLFVIKQKKNNDKRGFLRETYNDKIINTKFCFEYFTFSNKNVLRGFHFQIKNPQSKYVNVLKGKILDCVIDLRHNSKTFGKTFKIILSKENSLGLLIPRGFAHAYYSYEKENLIYYKLDNYYNPLGERGVIWNDRVLNVKWPNKNPLISKKDKILPTLKFCIENKLTFK
tara:strand:- start:12 stop:548 length:537 start_codon:yes stop_codon:yes gene_type:complete